MADFTHTATVRTAIRKLATPQSRMPSYTTIIGVFLADNPWGCTTYKQFGETISGVSNSYEAYSGKVVYENYEVNTVGTISIKAPTPSIYH